MEKNSNNNTSISFGFKFNLLIIFRLNNIFYCGAWCGYGFHEDGVVSAKNVAKYLI